jgi:hypothetical protein
LACWPPLAVHAAVRVRSVANCYATRTSRQVEPAKVGPRVSLKVGSGELLACAPTPLSVRMKKSSVRTPLITHQCTLKFLKSFFLDHLGRSCLDGLETTRVQPSMLDKLPPPCLHKMVGCGRLWKAFAHALSRSSHPDITAVMSGWERGVDDGAAYGLEAQPCELGVLLLLRQRLCCWGGSGRGNDLGREACNSGAWRHGVCPLAAGPPCPADAAARPAVTAQLAGGPRGQ